MLVAVARIQDVTEGHSEYIIQRPFSSQGLEKALYKRSLLPRLKISQELLIEHRSSSIFNRLVFRSFGDFRKQRPLTVKYYRDFLVKGIKMVPPSVLPYELLYCIMDVFDAASPEGRLSLFACSYANRALSTICQERLFRNVEISYRLFRDDNFHLVFRDDERTTGHKFLDFLAGSPHIGPYVQNFTINAMKPSGRPMSFASSGLSDTSSNTPSFSLYKIVPRLRNLKGFIITHTDGYYFCHWNAVEQRTKTFFISIVPLLTKIDLYLFVHLPLSMFSNSTNLEELRVSYLDMDREDVTPPSVSKVKLQALEVGYPAGEREPWTPWFNMPRLPLDVSKLRKLKLSDPYCPVLDIDETLKLCSETLEELDFHLAIYGVPLMPCCVFFTKDQCSQLTVGKPPIWVCFAIYVI